MRKKALAALLAAAMLAVTGCSGMPGMGTTNAPATKAGDEKAADAGSEANAGSNDTVYELKIHTSQTEQALITRNYQKLADTVNEKSDGRLSVKVFPADYCRGNRCRYYCSRTNSNFRNGGFSRRIKSIDRKSVV